MPFAVTVRIEAPGQYGHSHIQTVDVTIEIVSKLSAWMATGHSPLLPSPGGVRWLGPSEWTALLDAIIATLTAQAITTSLADLADVDAFLIPPPRTIHVVSDKEIAGFPTPYLRPVPCVQSAPLDGDGAGRAGARYWWQVVAAITPCPVTFMAGPRVSRLTDARAAIVVACAVSGMSRSCFSCR